MRGQKIEVSPRTRARMMKMRKDRVPIKKIAEEVRMSSCTVRRILREYGGIDMTRKIGKLSTPAAEEALLDVLTIGLPIRKSSEILSKRLKRDITPADLNQKIRARKWLHPTPERRNTDTPRLWLYEELKRLLARLHKEARPGARPLDEQILHERAWKAVSFGKITLPERDHKGNKLHYSVVNKYCDMELARIDESKPWKPTNILVRQKKINRF